MANVYPGDDVVPDAAMIYDRKHMIKAPPETIWPWLVQLGKGRGGWYLRRSWERFLPQHWRASRTIDPAWQNLQAGDRVEDYGKDEYFTVVSITPPHSLVYVSERYGTTFTWTLMLHPQSEGSTEVHLRFRGRIKSMGWKRKSLVTGGDFLDWLFSVPMLNGLAERAEQSHPQQLKLSDQR